MPVKRPSGPRATVSSSWRRPPLEPALARRLGRMAGFRNLMVYGYNKVDNQRMWQIMRSDLGDLDAYLEAVAALLARPQGKAE